MKFFYLTFTSLLFLSSNLFAQNSISWNAESAPLKGLLIETQAINSTEYYTLEMVRKNQWEINPDYLASFYSNGTKVSSNMVVVQNMKNTFKFKESILVKENLGIFTIGVEDEIKKLKFQTFSKKLESASEEITIGEYHSETNEYNDNFIIQTSRNGKFFAIIWIARQNSGADLKFYSRVYNNELNLISETENSVSFLKGVDLNTVLMSDLGQLFLATSNSTNPKRKETPEQFMLNLHCFIDSDIITLNVETGKKQISLVELISNNTNSATAVGTFFEDGGEKWLPGAFSVSADFSTKTIERENFQLYENALHKVDQPYPNYISGKPAKTSSPKEKVKDVAYRVRNTNDIHAEQLSDLSIFLVIESQLNMLAQSSSSVQTSESYRYGNMMALHFTIDGQLNWMHTIPKRQTSVQDLGNHCSYLFYSTDDQVNLIFLDNKNNYQGGKLKTDLDRLSMPRGLAKSDVTALVSIELETGQASRKAIDNPSSKNILYPTQCFVDYQKQEIMICAPNKKAVVFGTMKF